MRYVLIITLALTLICCLALCFLHIRLFGGNFERGTYTQHTTSRVDTWCKEITRNISAKYNLYVDNSSKHNYQYATKDTIKELIKMEDHYIPDAILIWEDKTVLFEFDEGGSFHSNPLKIAYVFNQKYQWSSVKVTEKLTDNPVGKSGDWDDNYNMYYQYEGSKSYYVED